MNTVLDVVGYLQEKGYKCGKSAVYNHVRRGLLVKRNGEYTPRDIDRYAALYLARTSGGEDVPSDTGELEQLQREKLAADALKAKAQAEHWELKTRVETGKYIDRDLFYGEMAARAAILKNDLETMIRSGAGAMVQACGGDPVKVPDVIAFWLARLETTLGRYSEEKTWTVPGPFREMTEDESHDD
jgi:hypothetical protein